MSITTAQSDIRKIDRRIAVTLGIYYVVDVICWPIFTNAGKPLDSGKMAIIAGGELVDFLLLIPVYLSKYWGFVLQLVLVVPTLLYIVIVVTRPGGAASITPLWIFAKVVNSLFVMYLVWRVATWRKYDEPRDALPG